MDYGIQIYHNRFILKNGGIEEMDYLIILMLGMTGTIWLPKKYKKLIILSIFLQGIGGGMLIMKWIMEYKYIIIDLF